MVQQTIELRPVDEMQRDALIEQMLEGASGVFNIFTIYIGDRLGLYEALYRHGPSTSTELAVDTGTHERYIREWLEQQTVADIVEVDDPSKTALEREYRLPAGHAEVLVNKDSMDFLAPLAQLIVGVTSPLKQMVEAYRTGDGVPYADYGEDMREGQGAINKAGFLNSLSTEWIPEMPDVYSKLLSAKGARVLDVGCGLGWSSIGIANHFPSARIDGVDSDEASINAARLNASQAGLMDQVEFHMADAATFTPSTSYDLVLALECVHDMADPVSVLAAIKRLVKPDGAVLIADERVAETFMGEGNDVEWMMYGWSVLHCLPVGLAEHPSVGTGTVMRPDTVREYATAAGFSKVEILPIDNYFFRFYRLYV